MTPEEDMIRPSDEIWFCELYFNEVYDFIKNGLPGKFEGLLNKYPKIKVYREKEINNDESYEFIRNADDGKPMYNKILERDADGLYVYEYDSSPFSPNLMRWNHDHQNKEYRAKQQGVDVKSVRTVEVLEQDVFRAISVFFGICKSVKGDENFGKIYQVWDEALQVMTLKTYVMDTVSPGIIRLADSLFIKILGAFGLNESSRNVNFCQRINQWCNEVCGQNRYDPYYNVKNALDFYRSIRNDSAHGSRLIPGQKDEIAFALYVCILLVYLCLKHTSISDVSLDSGCTLKCYVKGEVKLKDGDKTIQGTGGIGNEYELKPFTKYTVNGKSFELNFKYYGAIVNANGDIDTKVYQPIGQFSSIEIGTLFAEKLKEADSVVVQQLISLLNDNTGKLSNEIVQFQTDLKKDLEKLAAGCKDNIKDKIQEIIDRFKKRQDQLWEKAIKGIEEIKEDVKGLSENQVETKEILQTHTEESAEFQEDIKKLLEKIKGGIKWICIFVCLVVVSVGGYYLWDFLFNTADGAFVREDYELAYKKGHPNAAYEYARQLEDEKKYEEAAEWYRKAQTVYDNRLQAEKATGTSDVKSRIRLAQMYLRGKGGVFDLKKVFSYVEPIKNTKEGIGLYVYCCACDGEKLQEAMDQLSYAEKIAPNDEYVLLAKSEAQLILPNPKEKRTKENCTSAWKRLEQLAAKESEIREEALMGMAQLYLWGYFKEDETLHYNLYKGMDYLRAAAFEAKSIKAQTLLGEYLCRLHSFEDGYHAFDVAYRSGMVDALAVMVDVAVAMGQSERADSLRNKYMQKAQADPFFRNALDLEKRESRQAWQYQKKAFAAFNPTKHWINNEFVKDYVRNGLKSNVSVDSILKIDPSLDRNYVMAIKYAQGYGVEKNQVLADSLILLAVKDSLPDAIYTWGRLLDQRGKTLEAIAMLKKTADFDPRAAGWLSCIYDGIDLQRSKDYLIKSTDPSRAYKQMKEFWDWKQNFKNMPLWINDSQAPSWADKLERELCIQLDIYQDVSSISFLAGELACYYTSRHEPDDVTAFYIGIASRLGEEGYFSWLELSIICSFIGRSDVAKTAFMGYCIGYFKMRKPEDISIGERKVILKCLRAHFPDLEEPLKNELGFDFTEGIELTDKEEPMFFYMRTIQPNDSIYKY